MTTNGEYYAKQLQGARTTDDVTDVVVEIAKRIGASEPATLSERTPVTLILAMQIALALLMMRVNELEERLNHESN